MDTDPQELLHSLRNFTCGELSCDCCTDQREEAADLIEALLSKIDALTAQLRRE